MDKIESIMDLALILPNEVVQDIARSGSNEEAVGYWLQEWNSEAHWDIEKLRDELIEKGVEAEELGDDESVRAYALWLAAHNVMDNMYC